MNCGTGDASTSHEQGFLISGDVTFPPHNSSDADSNQAEVVEFLRTEKFREQVLREGLQAV
jgi:hypothetical protein